ncbi:hypothetical protein AB3N59_05315 [Leptospira sp. WS92.C1]
MILKKITTILFLVVLAIHCGPNGDKNSSTNQAVLLAIATPQDPGLSGIYASILAGGNNNGGGGAAAYSSASQSAISPFLLFEQTQDCGLGGTIHIKGDIDFTTDPVTGVNTSEYTGLTQTFSTCRRVFPVLDAENPTTMEMTINGVLTMDALSRVTMEPNPTPERAVMNVNETSRIRSNNYSVNGFLYPEFDLTFVRNPSQLTLENFGNPDTATITADETVHVSGTMGGQIVNTVLKYKVKFKAF